MVNHEVMRWWERILTFTTRYMPLGFNASKLDNILGQRPPGGAKVEWFSTHNSVELSPGNRTARDRKITPNRSAVRAREENLPAFHDNRPNPTVTTVIWTRNYYGMIDYR